MDFSDILFFIVFGFIGVVSYVSQQKAKKKAESIERKRRQAAAETRPATQRASMPETSAGTPDTHTRKYDDTPAGEPSLDEIFEALRQRKPLPRQHHTTTVEPSPPHAPDNSSPFNTEMPSAVAQEGIHSIDIPPATTPRNNTTDIPETPDEKHNGNRAPINWRDAVIAAEILNRKY